MSTGKPPDEAERSGPTTEIIEDGSFGPTHSEPTQPLAPADILAKELQDRDTRLIRPSDRSEVRADVAAGAGESAGEDEAGRERTEVDERAPRRVGGRQFGRYELLLRLGAGGMATLYLARLRGPQDFQKLVAIKKIHDHLTEEKKFVEMFLDEARISAMIHHPNVVQIFELGDIDGAYYLAMEYVHGQDLTQVLRGVIRKEHPGFTWELAARIVADAAAGLHAAHELESVEGKNLGLVHRDVSPQNILVSYKGHVKVVDFGVAFAAERLSRTGTGTVKGKLAYMSPEQCQGEQVDRRSDVFALGILLWETVCRKSLFREDTEAATVMRVHAADVPSPRGFRPDIPEELERIIRKALARKPADRHQTAEAMQRDLERLLAAEDRLTGPTEIAALMEDLFKERRQVRDRQIREASGHSRIEQALGLEATPLGRGEATTLGSSAAEALPGRRPRRRSWALPVALTVGVILAIIAAALLVTRSLERRRDRQDRAPGMAVRPATGPEAMRPEKKEVQLTFLITPREAELFLDDREVTTGKGSFTRVIQVPRAERPIAIRVQARGYATKMGSVLPRHDQTVTVSLMTEGAPARPGRPIKVTRTPARRRPRPAMTRPKETGPRTRPRAMRTGGVGAVDMF